jgi:hypothetical protein
MRASVLGAPNLSARSAWLDSGDLFGRGKSGSWISDNYPQGSRNRRGTCGTTFKFQRSKIFIVLLIGSLTASDPLLRP